MLKKMLCTAGVVLLMAFSGTQAAEYDAAVVKEWKARAERGDASFQCSLGECYAVGNCEGIPQDFPTARKWFEKAAAQGDTEAQLNLGVMYANGLSVRQNKQTAREWYGKACDNGDQRGCDAYRKLNETGF